MTQQFACLILGDVTTSVPVPVIAVGSRVVIISTHDLFMQCISYIPEYRIDSTDTVVEQVAGRYVVCSKEHQLPGTVPGYQV